MDHIHPRRIRYIHVQSWQDLSPHLRRIVFHSTELADYPFQCTGAHVKLFFPRPGQSKPVLPQLTDRGPVWPDQADKPFSRSYTLRHYNPHQQTISIDFAMHPHQGPAARFAQQVTTGQTLAISAPGGPVPMLKPADRYIMVGDLTALPAIDAMLEDMPATASGDLFLWLPQPADLPTLPRPARLKLHPFFGSLNQIPMIISAVCALPAPAMEHFIWLAGEASLVMPLRQQARDVWQMPLARCYAVPYWHHGENEEHYHALRHAFIDS
ncbi:siderophore-interacting protein [Neisseriaceae bacterium ESL0693]|nr:siderophore-interacting protein [Neisseriaceae bacterium ESL0693]